MHTWQDRLKAVLGPRGYENCMRRSLQTVILYEAKRCISHRLSSLRPFQRKAAYMDQAHALLESLDFLYPHQKAEVLWRTASSKETLDSEIAWKREKGIEKSFLELSNKIKAFIPKAKTHNEAVDMLIQHLFENLSGQAGKPAPANWEHAHNHCIMAYRMYYRFDQLDPTFPNPISPREIAVPTERPKVAIKAETNKASVVKIAPTPAVATAALETEDPHIDMADLLGENKVVEDRRKVLQEVREHLELLKEFEGVISDEELAKRKRELFAALPPAPPPAPENGTPSKKMKL